MADVRVGWSLPPRRPGADPAAEDHREGPAFTEVYGYGGARRAIWVAFLANVLMGFFALFMVWLPAAPGWPQENQRAFEIVFGTATRGILASLAAFWTGEFINSFVMAGSGYVFKVLYEGLATPLTYAVVAFLKRTEGVDVYDEGTDFSPFVKDA